jgi:hypothetical protein
MSSSQLNNDQKVLQDGRKNPLKDAEVPLREQSIKKLVKTLEEMDAGQRVAEIWNAVNARRSNWLERQRWLLAEYDEFIYPIYDSSQEWSSTLHLPVALTHAKTYHARFLAALLGVDPPFTVKARQEANVDRGYLIQELMRYTLNSWCNEYQGVEEAADAWLWSWVISGCGILKQRWDRKYSRYLDVVQKQVPGDLVTHMDEQSGQVTNVRSSKIIEVEEQVTKTAFDGPVIEWTPTEDVAIDGGHGDPQRADSVIQSVMMTASELWTLADMGVFREECVEKVIQAGENLLSGEPTNTIKVDKNQNAAGGMLDSTTDLQKYQILEAYMRLDVDGSGINTDVVMWVHKESREILRATYLRRVMPSGLRPFFKIDFHKRHGEDYGVGMIELLYSVTKEIDAVHNMNMDNGLISSLPFGFYRPSSSTSNAERMSMEPGSLIPLDNPQGDVYFPQLGNRTAFGFQEMGLLNQTIERLTGISDMSLGVIGGQGATRTATGARALLGESNANLDVFLRRMNRGWKKVLNYLFQSLQQKVPPGLQFRILGDDGDNFWATIHNKDALQGDFDFEIDANSANSNQTVRVEQANDILQTIVNPLLIQLGIVSPTEIYEAIKNKFKQNGIKEFSKFIRKPSQQTRMFTPEEVANRVLAGVDVQLGPDQDLQGFVAYVDHVIEIDELNGQFDQQQIITLVMKQRQAKAMISAMEQQQAQVANQQQMMQNSALAAAPSPTNPVGMYQPSAMPGGGGQQ